MGQAVIFGCEIRPRKIPWNIQVFRNYRDVGAVHKCRLRAVTFTTNVFTVHNFATLIHVCKLKQIENKLPKLNLYLIFVIFDGFLIAGYERMSYLLVTHVHCMVHTLQWNFLGSCRGTTISLEAFTLGTRISFIWGELAKLKTVSSKQSCVSSNAFFGLQSLKI